MYFKLQIVCILQCTHLANFFAEHTYQKRHSCSRESHTLCDKLSVFNKEHSQDCTILFNSIMLLNATDDCGIIINRVVYPPYQLQFVNVKGVNPLQPRISNCFFY